MKKIILPFILCAAVLTSCSSSKKSASKSNNDTVVSQSSGAAEDALSYGTAVLIRETNEGAGVDAEYKWIKNHYSNYTISGQKLKQFNGKPYDIITIVPAGSNAVDLYFDISKFFGEF